MPSSNTNSIDLAPLCHHLALCFRTKPLRGYRNGKTEIRNMLIRMFGCPTGTAQRLVETLEANGYIGFGSNQRRSSSERAHWTFAPQVEATASPVIEATAPSARRLTG